MKQVRIIGPVVRLELEQRDTEALVEAELTRERYQRDKFVAGEAVYLRPGNLRVFPAHSSARA